MDDPNLMAPQMAQLQDQQQRAPPPQEVGFVAQMPQKRAIDDGQPIVQLQTEPNKKIAQNQGLGMKSEYGPQGNALGALEHTPNNWNPQQMQQNFVEPNNQFQNQMGRKQSPSIQKRHLREPSQQFASQNQVAGQMDQNRGVGFNTARPQRSKLTASPIATRLSGSKQMGANAANRNQGRLGGLSPNAGGMRPQNAEITYAPQSYKPQNQNVVPNVAPKAVYGQQPTVARQMYQPNIQKAKQEDISIELMPLNQVDLVLPDRVVNKLMGPEPIPQIDIEEDEIQNELQRRLVDEIKCTMCNNFPYMPLECKDCHKIFCQYCQIQITKGSPPNDVQPETSDPANLVPTNLPTHKSRKPSVGRQGHVPQLSKPPCCPNCNTKGDFLIEVNPIVRNVVEFCEFPHRCKRGLANSEITWKTINELQLHVLNDECPKFGCDICYMQEYQYLTRGQLREHIKRECPEVRIQCQICTKEFKRSEFASHKCLKEFYMQKLKFRQMEIIEYMAQKMMMNTRQKKQLGPCQKLDCLDQFKASGKHQQENMMVARENISPVECVSCGGVTKGKELAYYCMYCQDNYCNNCMAYQTQFDLEELEAFLMASDPPQEAHIQPSQLNKLD